MKDSMFLIIALIIGSISVTQCTNQTSGQEAKEITQNTVNQHVVPDDIVSVATPQEGSTDEVLTNTNKELKDENEHLKSVEVNQNQKILSPGQNVEDINSKIKEAKNPAVEVSTVSNKIQEQETVKTKSPNTQIKESTLEGNENQELIEINELETNPTTESDLEKDEEETVIDQKVFNHEKWHSILQANVSASGKVNYSGIKSNIAQLNEYLELLSENTPKSSWTKNKTKAYWINAYNAFTIKLILNNYPVSKITDLHGGKPWDKKWINLGSETYSLNDIEHVILRPTYNDPRIHFAVNCAAKSCPKVWNNAWTEQNIESALDRLTKEFVSNKSANQISEKSVNLSKIFDWYKDDFGDLIQFLNKYSTTKVSAKAKITFNDYDWQLNS